MPLIRYIGLKPRKIDNVAGTPAVWDGPGTDQEVNDAAAAKLLQHPAVWALAEAIEIEAEEDHGGMEASDARFEHVTDKDGPVYRLRDLTDGTVVDLTQMDDAALKDFSRVHNIKADRRKKGDELRSLIVAYVIHQADPKV